MIVKGGFQMHRVIGFCPYGRLTRGIINDDDVDGGRQFSRPPLSSGSNRRRDKGMPE